MPDVPVPDVPVPGVPDVVAPGLAVLFCGINPGARSGATGRHFARPGNRFWKVLAGAGLTDRVLSPDEQHLLLDYGIGITNLVARTTASAAEVTRAELVAGAAELEAKVAVLRPARVAVLGVQAYRQAWGRRSATIGRQPEDLAGAGLWVLPNPSGLQARYQLPDMIAAYGELASAGPVSAGPVSAGPVSAGPVSAEPVSVRPASARRPVEQLEPGAGDAAELLLLDDERR